MNGCQSDAVEASWSVLIDALTILARYTDTLVVVGGWVPELAFPHRGHIGSLDVDLAIDAAHIGLDNAYTTIRQLLLSAGYQPTSLPNRFVRTVRRSGKQLEVKLDLITGDQPNRLQQVQEMSVANLRGVDLAFDFANSLEISGLLPEGGRNTLTVRVCDPRAFVCMKGICLWERKKEKDAYDVYFTLREYPGGPQAMANAFMPVLGHMLIVEGLRKLRSKFSTIEDIGPVWAGLVEQEQGGNAENAQRDAFERVTYLLKTLNIDPWPTGA